jgi:hypothetical protein
VNDSTLTWAIVIGIPLTLVGLPVKETWQWFTWNRGRTLLPLSLLVLVGAAASVAAWALAAAIDSTMVIGFPAGNALAQGLALAVAGQALFRAEIRPVTPMSGQPDSASSVLGAAAQRVQEHLAKMTERAQQSWIAELSGPQVVTLAHDIRCGYTKLAGRAVGRVGLSVAVQEQVKLLDARLEEARSADPDVAGKALIALRNFCVDEFRNTRRDRPTTAPDPYPGLGPPQTLERLVVSTLITSLQASSDRSVRIITPHDDLTGTLVEATPAATARRADLVVRPDGLRPLPVGERVWLQLTRAAETVWCEATVIGLVTGGRFSIRIERLLLHETRRRSPRARLTRAATMRSHSSSASGAASGPAQHVTVINLGEAGVRLRLPEHGAGHPEHGAGQPEHGVRLPDEVDLTVDLDTDGEIAAHGRVVRRDDHSVSVRLIDLTPADTARLARAVLAELSTNGPFPPAPHTGPG